MATKSIAVKRRNKESQSLPLGWEEVAQALLRNAGLGIYIVQEGKFQYVNPVFQNLTGYTEEELLGKYSLELVHSEDRKMVRRKAIANLRSEKVSIPYECRLVKKNSEILWVLEEVTSINYGGKRTTVGSFMDITAGKKSEEKLRESEEFSTRLLDNAPNPITVVNPDTSVKYVNPAFEKMTGFSLAEITGIKAPYPWWTEESRERYLTNIRGTIGDGRKKFKNEQIMQNRKGKRFWVELNSSSIMSHGKVKYHIANWLDISDRKRAEEKLRESEEFSTSLLDNAPNPIEVVNLDNSTRYVNKAFEELTGFTSAEVVGRKPPYLWWPEESKKELGDAIEKDLADINLPRMAEINIKKETVLQNKNGERLWAELSIAPLKHNETAAYLLVNWVDITERKEMEEALDLQRAYFQQLFDNSPDAIVTLDINKGLSHANKGFEMLFGYSAEELKGRDLIGFIIPEKDKQEASAYLQMVFRGEVVRREALRRCKDGNLVDVSILSYPIRLNDKLVGAYFIYTDITERKRFEAEREAFLQEIKAINQKLEEANKELQDFVYIASHDLREPLRKISSFGTLLQDSLKGKLDRDQRENFEFVIDGAQRMQDMVDALLTYSRLTTRAKPPEWVDLNKVIGDLKKLELATMLDEMRGVIHVPNPLPSVQADLSQMHQLLQNLIGNGLKFHKKGIPPETIIRAHELADNMIRIEVEDNGIGIDKKYHSQLFTMFKRLHPREEYGGTGIGLASCKKIVERHGGDIGIESTIGKGSTFWFTLPKKRCPSKKIKERR